MSNDVFMDLFFLGKLLFILFILFFLNIYTYYTRKKNLLKSNIVDISKAIICSSFGYFFLLTILIWDDFQREIHVIFIHIYIYFSQVQALTGL